MSSWVPYISALTAFFLSHAIPARAPVRSRLVKVLGQKGYLLAYSALSVIVLAWLIVAAANAPYVEVIPPWPVLRWVPLVVMPVVCWLAVAGLTIGNPFSFGGLGKAAFDPDRPGILRTTRHPLLAVLMLWTGAHLLTNGSLSHVILFGLFAGFAALGMALIDCRTARSLGADWLRLSRNTARFSLRAPLPWPPLHVWLASLAVFAVLIGLHGAVIGVSPLP